jgi:hypothetical protein
MARLVPDPVGGGEPAMQRSAPQHRRVVLLGHRDPAVELQRLLHRRIVERDQVERPCRDERAQSPRRLKLADQLRIAVDLRKRPVVGEVRVRDGVLGAVTWRVEAELAARPSLGTQRVRLPMQAVRDDAVDHVEGEARGGKRPWRFREEIDSRRPGSHDPCAFAATTSSTT